MRLAIVHYHLQTGGVTRIIEHAIAALQSQDVTPVILTGTAPETPWPVPVRVVPTLAYGEQARACTPETLGRDLEAAARDALHGPPDIWHIHNHSLGKNLTLPETLFRFAAQGQRLLLQIHDFPEDGRPANYRRLVEQTGGGDRDQTMRLLYPSAAQVHYAVLNERDQTIMEATGLPRQRLHDLPNPVSLGREEPAPADERDTGTRLWLYPTRAIRRKNLGEFLLLAALSGEDDLFATTRGPQNPAEQPVYRRWVDFADRLDLRIDFEIGARHQGDFRRLLESAHALVTTSVAEGFGMAFLEPWLVGRPLAGRNLPEITHEFSASGVDLSELYDRLDFPADWLDQTALRDHARAGLERLWGAYGRRPEAKDVERALGSWIQNQRLDFARLDEPLQRQVIERVAGSPAARSELPPWQWLAGPEDQRQRITGNRTAVLTNYGLKAYGPRLMGIYERILASPVERAAALAGEQILAGFLAPERLFLLRT